jgi:predicted nucleotidyltransferase
MPTRRDIRKVVDQIVARFEPEKVYLFGSYVYGRPTSTSDVDLLVVRIGRLDITRARSVVDANTESDRE